MQEDVIKYSCLGGKFLLSNYKKDKSNLIQLSILLKSFSRDFLGKEVLEKVYYDTKDFFFHKNGINISLNTIKGSKEKEICVRYDSEKERVNYLIYMPDTYVIKIDVKDSLSNHYQFMADSVTDMIANGLQVDLMELLPKIVPIVIVNKRRERWQCNNNYGLRLKLSFDFAEYSSPQVTSKTKLEMLEILSENPKEFTDAYNEFTNKLVVENPTIVKTSHSDLFIGLDYLFNMR